VTPENLIERTLSGERRALARLISLVENNGEEARQALASLYPHTGKAHIVGITGAPGTGKSTLVNRLALELRSRSVTVGIIAVDPTSPYSGGAILGDRIRMRDLSGDPGIFIRSMASRGNLGGLARATGDVVKIFDAAGYQTILVETVGAGQAEVEIARTAHTTLVVEAPGLGDDIQAIKAGLMEIADILIVNKADREGADNTVMSLQMMLDLNSNTSYSSRHHSGDMLASPEVSTTPAAYWRPPIIKTIATRGEGTVEAVDAIEQHATFLLQTGEIQTRERERAQTELQRMLSQDLMNRYLRLGNASEIEDTLDKIVAREVDVYSAVQTLLDQLEMRRKA